MKIFKVNSKPIEHVKISPCIADSYKNQLYQAKGVIENYMKDKNFDIVFNKPGVCCKDTGDSIVEIMGHHHPHKGRQYGLIKPDSNTPFLRNVYQAIETIAQKFRKK